MNEGTRRSEKEGSRRVAAFGRRRGSEMRPTKRRKAQRAVSARCGSAVLHQVRKRDSAPGLGRRHTLRVAETRKLEERAPSSPEESNSKSSSEYESLPDFQDIQKYSIEPDKDISHIEGQLAADALDEQFKKSLNTLLRCPLAFKKARRAFTYLDYEAITQKNVMEDFAVSFEKLQSCLKKSVHLVDAIAEEREEKQESLLQKLHQMSHELNAIEKLKEQNNELQEEIEKFIKQQKEVQTWLQGAIEQNIGIFEISGSGEVVYDRQSLGLFGYKNRFRIAIVKFTEHRMFDGIICTLILIDSMSQAIYDYSDVNSVSSLNQQLEIIQQFTTLLFATEALLKIIAQGLVQHRNAYLRDVLNIFDFLVVLTSFEVFIQGEQVSLKPLRVLRVVRPLRTIKRVPSLRRLVQIIVRSVPDMINTMVFFSFFLITTSIFGMQLFGGVLYQRCRLSQEPAGPTSWPTDPRQRFKICEASAGPLEDEYKLQNQHRVCSENTYCHAPHDALRHFPTYDILAMNDPWRDPTILYNTQNFQNFWTSLITVFQAITLEDWYLQRANLHNAGFFYSGTIFYIIIVFFGHYFILNLVLAVIMSGYLKYSLQVDLQYDQDLKQKETYRQRKVEDKQELMELIKEQMSAKLFKDLRAKAAQQSLASPQTEGSKVGNFKSASQIVNLFLKGKPTSLEGPPVVEDALKESARDAANKPRINTNLSATRDISEEDAEKSNRSINQSSFRLLVGVKGEAPASTELSKKRALRRRRIHQDSPNIGRWATQRRDEPDNRVQRAARKIYDSRVIQLLTELSLVGFFFMQFTLNVHPMSDASWYILEYSNITVAVIMSSDLVFELVAYGFMARSTLIFGIGMATLAIAEAIIVLSFGVHRDTDELGNFSRGLLAILYQLRFLKLVKLCTMYEELAKILRFLRDSFKEIISFYFLMFLFIFMYSLLGMQLFAYAIFVNSDDEIVPVRFDSEGKIDTKKTSDYHSVRLNFDNIGAAILSLHACLIGDEWPTIMRNTMRAKETSIYGLYFIPWIFISQFFLMNMFLVIHIKYIQQKEKEKLGQRGYSTKTVAVSFDTEEKPIIEDNKRSVLLGLRHALSRFARKQYAKLTLPRSTQRSITQVMASQNEGGSQEMDRGQTATCNDVDAEQEAGACGSSEGSSCSSMYEDFEGHLHPSRSLASMSDFLHTHNIVLRGKSLFIFSEDNKLRIFLKTILTKGDIFEVFIQIVILVQIVIIALNSPLKDHARDAYFVHLETVQNVITYIFIVELFIKVIVFGLLFNGSSSYLRSGWNILDSIIVLISVTGIILDSGSGHADRDNLEAFKILRVVRVLRLLSRNEGLRHSVLGLIYSFPGIVKAIAVVTVYSSILMMFFVNSLAGKFWHCDFKGGADASARLEQVIDKYDCINSGGFWTNSSVNFDSIPEALIASLAMLTREGWIEFMFKAVDSTELGVQPKENSSPQFYPIFICYMIFLSLFLGNLFIEVVIATYERQRKIIDRDRSLTEFQHEWINIQLMCYECKPRAQVEARDDAQKKVLAIVEHKYFDSSIMGLIILNTIVLMTNGADPQSQWFQQFHVIMENVFLVIFTLECLLKLYAYRKIYFRDNWNIFDFVIVAGSAILAFVQRETNDAQGHLSVSVIRMFRVLRIFRLIKKARSMNDIFNSFLNTIHTFANVLSLIAISIYLFSVLGDRIFAKVMFTGDLSPNTNFQSFGNSVLALIRIMTGEGWYKILADLSRSRDVDYDCSEEKFDLETYKARGHQTYGCGMPTAATIFIPVFIVIVCLILINLFIAVTLQGFQDVQRKNQSWINDIQLQQYSEVWATSDAEGRGLIHISEVGNLLRNLIKKKCQLFPSKAKLLMYDNSKLQQFIVQMNLKLYKKFQYYNFHDILIALSQNYVKSMVTRDKEQNPDFKQIMDDYEGLFGERGSKIEQVLQKIDEIRLTNRVQACRELNNTIKKFTKSVGSDLDTFEGNYYTSYHIPIVINLQNIYRMNHMAKQGLAKRGAPSLRRGFTLTSTTVGSKGRRSRALARAASSQSQHAKPREESRYWSVLMDAGINADSLRKRITIERGSSVNSGDDMKAHEASSSSGSQVLELQYLELKGFKRVKDVKAIKKFMLSLEAGRRTVQAQKETVNDEGGPQLENGNRAGSALASQDHQQEEAKEEQMQDQIQENTPKYSSGRRTLQSQQDAPQINQRTAEEEDDQGADAQQSAGASRQRSLSFVTEHRENRDQDEGPEPSWQPSHVVEDQPDGASSIEDSLDRELAQQEVAQQREEAQARIDLDEPPREQRRPDQRAELVDLHHEPTIQLPLRTQDIDLKRRPLSLEHLNLKPSGRDDPIRAPCRTFSRQLFPRDLPDVSHEGVHRSCQVHKLSLANKKSQPHLDQLFFPHHGIDSPTAWKCPATPQKSVISRQKVAVNRDRDRAQDLDLDVVPEDSSRLRQRLAASRSNFPDMIQHKLTTPSSHHI